MAPLRSLGCLRARGDRGKQTTDGRWVEMVMGHQGLSTAHSATPPVRQFTPAGGCLHGTGCPREQFTSGSMPGDALHLSAITSHHHLTLFTTSLLSRQVHKHNRHNTITTHPTHQVKDQEGEQTALIKTSYLPSPKGSSQPQPPPSLVHSQPSQTCLTRHTQQGQNRLAQSARPFVELSPSMAVSLSKKKKFF